MAATHAQRSTEIDHVLLEQAADWLVQFHAGTTCDADQRAWERWHQTSTEHARAWERAKRLLGKLETLPPALAMPSLMRKPDGARRAAMLKLLILGMAVPAGWWTWQRIGVTGMADFHTGVGETRELHLADGSLVTLNTDTALNVRFDQAQRHLHLLRGEIHVATAADPATSRRPFRVASQEGAMEALGTRFTVRQVEGRTHLAVFDGAVRITPSETAASSLIVQAGEQAWFDRKQIAPVTAADALETAWLQGMLMADNMRLADFAAELARYRPGLLRVESAVASLRVSGSYPIGNTDQTLAMLVSTYPLNAVTRLGGRWVTLVARTDAKK